MRATLLLGLPSLLVAEFTESQLALARKQLRHQILHHTNAKNHTLVEQFVEKMMAIAMADTDNHVQAEDWKVETNFINHPTLGEITEETYTSPSFKLMTGNAHFTLNPLYRVPLPKGDVMIHNQIWNVVRGDTDDPVPLSDLYNHHWLIGGDAPLDLCEDDFFFGGGAEYRTMDYTMPDGYGQARIGARGNCGGNFHFINTQDLLLEWDDFNNPKGNKAAAAKNCAECSWEPNRADGLCQKWGDGSFLCCFTESRCKVNNPHNKTKEAYRMKGKIYYTRDFSTLKGLQVNLVDIGGGPHSENGQVHDYASEWNVAANLNNEGIGSQRCDDKMCVMTNSYVIGDGSRFGFGICSGEMLWSYIHVHAGTLGGNVSINGKQICATKPVIGTDPHMKPGNEQGYLVGVETCIDERLKGNKIRLNKGDVLTATAAYDVDSTSTMYAPVPGGKHGGIMALFFSLMECDEGTWNEVYVVRNGTCVGAPRSKARRIGKHYKTRAECEAGTDAEEPVREQLALPQAEPVQQPSDNGAIQIQWRDCGNSDKLVTINSVTPETMKLGGKHIIEAHGDLAADIESANISVKIASGGFGVTLLDWSAGDACNGESGEWTLAHQIHFEKLPWTCPMKAGKNAFSSKFRLFVDPLVPVFVAHTTTTILAHNPEGKELLCFEVVTATPTSEIQV